MSDVYDSLMRFRRWFVEDALPFWADHGYDAARGGFYEALAFDGTPSIDRPRRVRTQARQIHAFSQAGLRGWHNGAEALAAEGFSYFLDHACPDEGSRGCVHHLSDDGSVLDDRRDLYDQAFLLLACASRWEAAKDQRALALADRTISFLDNELASDHGGWLESDRKELPRRQNPHMHLFEAFLALHRVTGDQRYASYANRIYGLFSTVFYDREKAVLREFFDEEWRLADEAGHIEPGHMFEWVWLLHEHDRQQGQDNAALARQLYDQAVALGGDPNFYGFVDNRHLLGETSGHCAKRLWPQTEFLRASIFLHDDDKPASSERISVLIDSLFKTYLAAPVQGLWIDEFSAAGALIAKDVPASILYHLFEAVAEADAWINARPVS